MKKILRLISPLVLLFCLTQSACKKDQQNISPEVKTVEATAVSSTKAILKGSIVVKGSYAIADYGFLYSTSSTDINNNYGTKLSLGANADQGDFSKTADGLAIIPTDNSIPTLYVKAYITTEKGTIYGQVVSTFMSTTTNDNISSKVGAAGDQLVFKGQFNTTGLEVIFGTNKVKGKILSTLNDQILVEIPTGIVGEHKSQIPVQVTSSGVAVVTISDFTIIAHITDFNPKSGPSDTPVIFSGDNLPAAHYVNGDVVILFDGGAIGSPYYNNADFRAAISSTLKVTETQLSVVINKKTTLLPGKFKITPPQISSITPLSGIPGTKVTVVGTDLPTRYNFCTAVFPTVTLGGKNIPEPPTNTDGKSIVFEIPSTLAPGTYDFSISVGPYNVTATQKITVLAPAVSGFTPDHGWFGSYLSILGTFLPGKKYTVSFGSVSVDVDCYEDGKINFPVPNGVTKGSVVLAVTINGSKVVVTNNFKIVGPSITSFSPTSGPVGSTVVINGEGFNGQNIGYYNLVFVGLAEANILSIDPRQLYIQIPFDAKPGPQKIKVTANGDAAVSTIDFVVTP